MSDEKVTCWRCGVPAHVTYLSVRTFDGTQRWVDEAWCVTDGCVDGVGSRTPFAPTPQELFDRADRMWRARHRALIEER